MILVDNNGHYLPADVTDLSTTGTSHFIATFDLEKS